MVLITAFFLMWAELSVTGICLHSLFSLHKALPSNYSGLRVAEGQYSLLFVPAYLLMHFLVSQLFPFMFFVL